MEVSERWGWVWPLTGLLFVAAFAAGALIGGETPEADESGQAVLAFYDENRGNQEANAFLYLLAAALLVFFAGFIHRTIRGAEGDAGGLSAVALAGGALAALGVGVLASMQLALAQAPDEGLEPAGAQALNLLSWHLFAPLQVGGFVLGIAAGIGALRTGTLPAGLAWLAIVAGVLWATPLWFIAGPALLLWILITSIVLMRRSLVVRTVRDDG